MGLNIENMEKKSLLAYVSRSVLKGEENLSIDKGRNTLMDYSFPIFKIQNF